VSDITKSFGWGHDPLAPEGCGWRCALVDDDGRRVENKSDCSSGWPSSTSGTPGVIVREAKPHDGWGDELLHVSSV